ncbi:MAG: biotin synthase BioB [Gammaproteobacteria bacterium]|nr:biotin synthase BioB [Gammaproteobacteria bacterium]
MVQLNESQRWSASEVQALFDLPFSELLYQAQTVHRQHFSPNEVQKSRLVNIKTGGCPEDCKYCSQSIRYATEVQPSKLMSVEEVIADAKSAKADGASRYCMGAAWRGPKARHMNQLCQMISEVKALGMETCMTLGLLDRDQANQLKQAGLDYYNHNVDTSPEYYDKIITTRTFEDRLQTIGYVREAGMKVCCGGILGMGETQQDRGSMLRALANLEEPPESVPINMLVPIPGTPLEGETKVEPLEFIRTIAVARIMMPKSVLRLSAGRRTMSEELQAMCFFAGANSIFVGDRLLTTDNVEYDHDAALFDKLGIVEMLPDVDGETVSNTAEFRVVVS